MTRPLDKHLDDDELDGLVWLHSEDTRAPRRLSEQSTEEALRHMESCPGCSRNVQKHKSVQMEISRIQSPIQEMPGLDCPKSVDWVRVAAGLIPNPETKNLMSHASRCGHCGPSLRRAVEFLSEETTTEEEHALLELRTRQPGRQKDQSENPHRHELRLPDKDTALGWKAWAFWPKAAFTGAVATLLVAAFSWGFTYFRKPSAEQLLAQAYSEQRTLELRIPGAQYAPMRVDLGPVRSHADRPVSLLKAEVLIAENLGSQPDSARWLHARGQSEILEGDYDAARRDLQRAHALSPDDQAIEVDLASAASGNGSYGEALNLLRHVTHSNPRNSVAWFNLALTCEKLELLTDAVSAWNSFLALDSGSPWAGEARKKKNEIEQKLDPRPTSRIPTELKDVVTLARKDTIAFDERIESYLDDAVSDWLPLVGAGGLTAKDALEAAFSVATVAARQHQDRWLQELVLNTDDSSIRGGLLSLAEAVRDSKAGNYSSAGRAARRAELLFGERGVTAGIFRARFERIYAEHLSQRGESCFKESDSLLDDLRGKPYAWLEVRTSLERAICANMTGRMEEAKLGANSALKLALEHHYGALHLRATALASTLEWTTGNFDTATTLATEGLKEFWSASYPSMVGYNLYAVLESVAQDSEQWFTQVSIGREAMTLLGSDSDHSLRAIMHQTLANAALNSGELDIADENFRSATQQLTLVSSDESTRTSRAVTEAGMAKMEFLQGEFEIASRRVQRIEPILVGVSNRFVLLDFYLSKGDILAAIGQRKQAEDAFSHAVAVSEQGLASIKTERDRLLWTRLYERSYRALIELVLIDDPSQAFSWWEWYRSAPLGRVSRASFGQSVRTRSRTVPDRAEKVRHSLFALIDEDTVLLSYVFLRTEAGGWLKSSSETRYRKFPLSSMDLQDLAKRFSDDCANPNSSSSALRDEARKLFQVLISPYIDSIGSHHKIIVEADGVLDHIPFELLIDDRNSFLGDNYSVSISPGLLYLSQARSQLRSLEKVQALIVGNSDATFSAQRMLNPIPRADEEARQIAQVLPHSRLLIGREASALAIQSAIQNVDIFHFAGHAVITKDGSSLVISGASSTDASQVLDALNFENMHLRRAKLVVLSGCATAGSGTQTLGEIRSLARILISSGVSQVIASRWDVDSEATTDLMEAFYARLLVGETVSKALQDAKVKIRNEKQFSHPYYWASFSVFGTA